MANLNQSVIRVLGQMTGTSCDGIEGSVLEFKKSQLKVPEFNVIAQNSFEYPKALKKKVLALQFPDSKTSLKDLLELNRDLSLWYGKIAREFKKHSFDLIANHGQTVAHFPDLKPRGVTLQLGDSALISELTQTTVASLFRNGDLASGGQGAPLVPLYHQILAHQLSRKTRGISIHNLGGISNMTYIESDSKLIAFDTGPANVWIDSSVLFATHGKKSFDKNGALASRGLSDLEWVRKFIKKTRYFKLPPPKSTGRDDFSELVLKTLFLKHNEDTIATLTLLTAETVVEAYSDFILKKRLPLNDIYFCGGGTKNSTLMLWISDGMKKISPKTKVHILPDAQFIESQAFAYFGYRSLFGKAVGGPWTGGSLDAPSGQITPGKNWSELLSKIQAHSRK